jgi:hypothetical protein
MKVSIYVAVAMLAAGFALGFVGQKKGWFSR